MIPYKYNVPVRIQHKQSHISDDWIKIKKEGAK